MVLFPIPHLQPHPDTTDDLKKFTLSDMKLKASGYIYNYLSLVYHYMHGKNSHSVGLSNSGS